MQNSITFMGPFIVQNSQQTAALAGSAILLKVNVRANVRRGPNTMKICGRVWGLFQEAAPKRQDSFKLLLATYNITESFTMVVVVVQNQKISQWATFWIQKARKRRVFLHFSKILIPYLHTVYTVHIHCWKMPITYRPGQANLQFSLCPNVGVGFW